MSRINVGSFGLAVLRFILSGVRAAEAASR